MKKYNAFGKPDPYGKYDQYGIKLKHENFIIKIKKHIHNYRQNRMIIPTDPEIIKQRANKIREEIKQQKIKRLELAELNKDIELIKFHARMNGKLKPDNSDYYELREKQDTKELLDE